MMNFEPGCTRPKRMAEATIQITAHLPHNVQASNSLRYASQKSKNRNDGPKNKWDRLPIACALSQDYSAVFFERDDGPDGRYPDGDGKCLRALPRVASFW